MVLGPAAAAHRWRVAVCSEADGAEPAGVVRSVLGAPAQELAPEAGVWEANALAGALDELAPRYWRPGARTSPHVDGVQVVGIEMWLAVDPAIWEPFSATASAGEVSVSATATPQAIVWEFSDPPDIETIGQSLTSIYPITDPTRQANAVGERSPPGGRRTRRSWRCGSTAWTARRCSRGR